MASEMEKNLSAVKSIVETVTSRLGYATLKKEEKDAILFVFCSGEGSFRSVTNQLRTKCSILSSAISIKEASHYK